MISLRRAATADNPTRILLLHGMANSDRVWDTVVPLFAPRVEVWAANLPWRADTDPTWSHHPDPAHWIAEAIDAVPGGVDVLVAHSFSAVLTTELLARQPVDVRGAVLVSPFYRRQPADFRFEVIGTLVHNFELAMREGIRTQTRRRVDESIHGEMARLVCERVGPYGWSRFLDAYLRTPWLRTEMVEVPCLTVAGVDDATAPPAEAEILAADLPDARSTLLAGCGHFPMTEQPAVFAEQVNSFLETVGTRFGRAGHLRPAPRPTPPQPPRWVALGEGVGRVGRGGNDRLEATKPVRAERGPTNPVTGRTL